MKKVKKEKIAEKSKGLIHEFKSFISRGNVVDLAVGVIIGSAFGKIITSIVNDILMPIIGILLGGLDFTNLTLKVGSATIRYGSFIQNVVDFIIVSICIFIFVKIVNHLLCKKDIKEETNTTSEVELLCEIRDLLKEK